MHLNQKKQVTIQNQHKTELISAQNIKHKFNNKDLSRLW